MSSRQAEQAADVSVTGTSLQGAERGPGPGGLDSSNVIALCGAQEWVLDAQNGVWGSQKLNSGSFEVAGKTVVRSACDAFGFQHCQHHCCLTEQMCYIAWFITSDSTVGS